MPLPVPVEPAKIFFNAGILVVRGLSVLRINSLSLSPFSPSMNPLGSHVLENQLALRPIPRLQRTVPEVDALLKLLGPLPRKKLPTEPNPSLQPVVPGASKS